MSASPRSSVFSFPYPRKMRRKIIKGLVVIIIAIYTITLAWGYLRLPWAAIKNLSNSEAITRAPAISFAELGISEQQHRYLKCWLAESPVPVTPRVNLSISWNALLCARVQSGFYGGPLCGEWKDGLYVCLFGFWVPIYTFSWIMA